MKTNHNLPQSATRKPPFKPRALTVQERNAIDLLITGATDGKVAEALGVDRGTIWRYRHKNPIFMAELERARAEVWRAPQEKLRSLMRKAVENVAALVEEGSYDASIELLKITGMYRGLANHIGEQNPEKLLEDLTTERLAAEHMPDKYDLLIDVNDSPLKRRRKQEIEAELWAEYGEEG